MSRVLLFVPSKLDGRPSCGRSFGESTCYNQTRGREYAEKFLRCRWWLVECENADAGRMVIECEHPTKQCDYHCGDHGRILASGGRP